MLAARAEPLGNGRGPRPGGETGARKGRSRGANKPKEPSKLVLGIGLAAVVLIGIIAVSVLTLTGGDDDPAETAADGIAGDELGSGEEGATDTTPAVTDTTVAPGTTFEPDVEFDEAALGPIQADSAYSLAIQNGPPDATGYQIFVDDQPVGEPTPEIPAVAFTPGKHLVQIQITHPGGTAATKKVVVYALGGTPAATWRANLASVNIETEGWAHAVGQFDSFVAAGHQTLQIYPSDLVPSLTPGFWNIFVGGFESAEAANGYCTQSGLEVGVTCFAVFADPAAPAGG